ncbi:T9SS type A sorting domain-containing protein [Bacteroides salyersiae]|jgi:sialate O-acetylesterase|uniref:GDSL-type esterase/lipase family protein n=1 Tax=Bacteroides salyersiae TaxID=291644 RepID=UPI00125DCDF9|nr:GDSL-type esterase/lipase family protein [Bacteroides salyersiae]KAB5344979.1 T9SS type A sorting domain-containing protein [Bacteroides salyersiae]KAB5353859.1 T9SS type A sorting domain-containing protein [Bacteroides salyersiae]KAB5355945.1 T9SS type A sorting domain-containing protein [Bacteroides salyersiae]KAB5366124.1 T9SS type A sorting domain-containing protein [Bacteroides salyersiae]KAB5369056.1 T9SS type A sorting domain-containing protein [Bacteroides salyersiae]
MKKNSYFFLFLLMFLGVLNMQAAPITQPDPETVYSIVHVQTGLYFEYNNRNVSAYSGSDNQLFKFEPVEKDGVVYYRIVNPASGLYFYTHDSWDMGWTNVTNPQNDENRALYSLVLSGDDVVIVGCSGQGGRCIGTNSGNADTWLSSDKYQDQSGSKWQIVEYDPKEALTVMVTDIHTFLNGITFGTEYGEYPVEQKDIIELKLEEAQALLDKVEATEDEFASMATLLKDAFAALKNSQNIFASVTAPEDNKEYYLIHVKTGLYYEYDTRTLQLPNGLENQHFIFEEVDVDSQPYYRMKSKASGKYHYLHDSWDIGWTDVTNPQENEDRALYQIIPIDNAESIVLKSKHESYGSCLGTDAGTDNTYVSGDKYADQVQSQWRIIEVPVGIVKVGLKNKIQEIRLFISEAKFGIAIGEYPVSQKELMESKLDEADLLLADDEATQEEIDNMVATLTGMFETLQASKNAFELIEGQVYNILSSGLYVRPSASGSLELSAYSAEDNQLFKFTKVAEEEGFYHIQNAMTEKYLSRGGDGLGDDWVFQWVDDPASRADRAKFKLVMVENEGDDVVQIMCKYENKYWGANNIGVGATLFSDKDGSVHFRITLPCSGDDCPCIGFDGKDCPALITLNLDMNGLEVSSDGVWVSGNFNGWAEPGSDESAQLTDPDGDGIYTVLIRYSKMVRNSWDAGNYKEHLAYRFSNGKGNANLEKVYDDCAYLTNRTLLVYDDMEIPAVKLGICGTEATERIKVACIGDSNTHGTGWHLIPVRDAWPVQLRGLMGQDEYQIQNFGKPSETLVGWMTSGDSYHGMVKEFDPDIVLINLGTNDACTWNGANPWSEERAQAYEQAYRNLIADCKTNTAAKEIYMVTPVIAAANNGMSIDNNIIKDSEIPIINKLSKELALPVIDFYAATDAAWGNNVGGSCADGIHMNSANEQAVPANKAAEILKAEKPVISKNNEVLTADKEYAEYRWYLDGALIPDATEKSYTATQYGTYKLGVRPDANTNDVLISDDFVLSKPTGVSGQENKNLISVYPNPVLDVITIAGVEDGSIDAKLFDNMGRLLLCSSQAKMDLSSLSAGIYFLHVNGEIIKVIKK